MRYTEACGFDRLRSLESEFCFTDYILRCPEDNDSFLDSNCPTCLCCVFQHCQCSFCVPFRSVCKLCLCDLVGVKCDCAEVKPSCVACSPFHVQCKQYDTQEERIRVIKRFQESCSIIEQFYRKVKSARAGAGVSYTKDFKRLERECLRGRQNFESGSAISSKEKESESLEC